MIEVWEFIGKGWMGFMCVIFLAILLYGSWREWHPKKKGKKG